MSNRVICTVKLHVILKCCVFTSEYCWVCREQWPEVFALILETVWGTDATVCTAYYCRLFLEMVKWLQSWKKAVSLERWQRGYPLHYISDLHCTCAGEPGPWCSMWRHSESQDPLRPPSSLQEEHYWYHPTLPREWGLLMLAQHTLTHHARGIRYGGGTCTQSGRQLDRRKCSFYSLHARTVLLGRGVFIGCPLCLLLYTLQNLTVYLKTSYIPSNNYILLTAHWLRLFVAVYIQSCWDEHLSCTSVYQFWSWCPQCRLRWRVRYRGDATRHSLLIVTKNRMGRRGKNWHTNPALHQHHSPSHKGFILLTLQFLQC